MSVADEITKIGWKHSWDPWCLKGHKRGIELSVEGTFYKQSLEQTLGT